MTASRLLSVLTIREVRLGTVVREFQTPRSFLTPGHSERTTNKCGKEIYTGIDRRLVHSGAKRTHFFFQIIVTFFNFQYKKIVNTKTTCNKCSFDYLH